MLQGNSALLSIISVLGSRNSFFKTTLIHFESSDSFASLHIVHITIRKSKHINMDP